MELRWSSSRIGVIWGGGGLIPKRKAGLPGTGRLDRWPERDVEAGGGCRP